MKFRINGNWKSNAWSALKSAQMEASEVATGDVNLIILNGSLNLTERPELNPARAMPKHSF